VEHILSRLGAVRILEDTLGDRRARAVITAATNMSCAGNVFEHVSEWYERSMIGGNAAFAAEGLIAIRVVDARGTTSVKTCERVNREDTARISRD